MKRPFQRLVKTVSNFFSGTKGVYTPKESVDKEVEYHPEPNSKKYHRALNNAPGITDKERKAKRREQGTSRNINHLKAKDYGRN
jgi:hypothetical protein